MSKAVFVRHYKGKEFRAYSRDDFFDTKREAVKRAIHYRKRGYNARVAHNDEGTKRYKVYHSVEYSGR